jgi:endogenous inhibitor of DNA gyrase (YacG/DUF329 family)
MEKPSCRIVACPTCRKSIVYDIKNPSRPFCSERCKVIDTAGWAEESFRIPSETSFEDLDQLEEEVLRSSEQED